MEKAQAQAHAAYTSGHEYQYHVGENVYLSTDNIRQQDVGPAVKLQDPWIGPLMIMEVINSRTVKLALPQGCRIDNCIHTSHIKPATTSTHPPAKLIIVDDGGTAPLCEVEDIVDHECRRRQPKQFVQRVLVKWCGWSAEFNTWEPIEHLSGAQELLDEYCHKHFLTLPPKINPNPVSVATETTGINHDYNTCSKNK